MKTHYVLIDFENVQVKSLALLKGDHFSVKVFIGPKNTKLPVDLVLAMQKLGNNADYIKLEVSGANALDFHITYYLGALTAADPDGVFHIISRDTGFDSLIKHLKSRKVACERSVSIEEMVGVRAIPVKTVGTAADAAPGTNAGTTEGSAPTKAKAKPRRKKAIPAPALSEALKIVIANFNKRKDPPPGTVTSLQNTIRSLLKKRPAEEVAPVFDDLVKHGFAKVEGNKVRYELPKEL